IGRAVMRGPGRFDAVKLEEHRALLEAGFIDLRRHSTRQETPACGGERRPRELGVSGQRIRVADRTICRDPMRFGHRVSSPAWLPASRLSRSAYRPAG